MAHKNEEKIKQAIVRGRDGGLNDRDGGKIPLYKRGGGKGDRNRSTPLFQKNYDLIDWSK